MVPLVKLKNKINVAEGTNYMFNIPVKVKKAEDEEKQFIYGTTIEVRTDLLLSLMTVWVWTN